MVADVRHHTFPSGELKELVLLFLPILVMTFFGSFYLFVEKLLLVRLSADTMEAAVNASIVCRIFQAPCIALAMMAQVFVGRWHGAKQWKAIGPGIWQFIWFSFLSMLVTVPLSIIYGKYYFEGTAVENIVMPYFYFLVGINFLHPLSAALTCLFLGQGKTRLILCATIGSQILKLMLAYLLIFGWGVIPSLGLMGGALSTLIAQGGLCLLLLGVFLNPKHKEMYHSRSCRFNPKLFWDCIYPGFLRAAGGVLVFTCWASIAHIMIAKGGDYLLFLSIGSTLFTFLPFFSDAICQAQTTVVSQILGAYSYPAIKKAFHSCLLLVLIVIAIVSIPLVFFPSITFHYLFPNIVKEEMIIRNVFFGVWVSFAFFTLSYIPISYILAYKDTKFSLFMGIMNWIDGYLLMYIAIEKMNIEAEQFWLVLSLMHISIAIMYYLRMKWLQSQDLTAYLQRIPNST